MAVGFDPIMGVLPADDRLTSGCKISMTGSMFTAAVSAVTFDAPGSISILEV